MNVKSAQTLTLLVSLTVLSLTLLGCGTTLDKTSSSSQVPISEPAPSPQTSQDPSVARGLSLYNTQCKACHGANGAGGSGPTLIGKTPSASYIQSNMPRTKPGSLSSEQVSDLVAYITSLK